MPAVVGDPNGARHEQADDARKQAMLDGLDARPQARFVVAGQDRHRLLGEDRATVERGVDEVDRDAGHDHAMLEGVADAVRARERRQQRGMGVDDPARVGSQHERADQPQVPGQHHDIGAGAGERLGQRGVVATRDEGRVDPLLGSPVESWAGPIGDDEDDVAAQLAAGRGRMEGPEVGAGSGDGDRDPRRFAHSTDPSGPSV